MIRPPRRGQSRSMTSFSRLSYPTATPPSPGHGNRGTPWNSTYPCRRGAWLEIRKSPPGRPRTRADRLLFRGRRQQQLRLRSRPAGFRTSNPRFQIRSARRGDRARGDRRKPHRAQGRKTRRTIRPAHRYSLCCLEQPRALADGCLARPRCRKCPSRRSSQRHFKG